MEENSIEFVTCCHVLEHLQDPVETLRELRRIASRCLIVVCPLEKKYKWGLNYHITFFPDKSSFLDFIFAGYTESKSKNSKHSTFVRLGDAMYIELAKINKTIA